MGGEGRGLLPFLGPSGHARERGGRSPQREGGELPGKSSPRKEADPSTQEHVLASILVTARPLSPMTPLSRAQLTVTSPTYPPLRSFQPWVLMIKYSGNICSFEIVPLLPASVHWPPPTPPGLILLQLLGVCLGVPLLRQSWLPGTRAQSSAASSQPSPRTQPCSLSLLRAETAWNLLFYLPSRAHSASPPLGKWKNVWKTR